MLQNICSPYLKDVVQYLALLMKNFKAEMDQVLTSDKLLKQEIIYELSRFEKEEEKQKTLLERENQHINNTALKSNQKRRKSLNSSVKSKKSAMKSNGKKSRRESSITFHPSAIDVADRSSTGVLKTPIPTSHKKKGGRRSSLQNEIGALIFSSSNTKNKIVPRLCYSERKPVRSALKKKIIINDENLLALTVKSSQTISNSNKSRKWSLETSFHPKKDLTNDLSNK